MTSIVERAYANLTPFRALTGAGVGLSAFLLFGNLGAGRFGIMPMVDNAVVRQRVGIPIELAVRQWDFFFRQAAPPVVVSVACSAAAYLAASFYVPKAHPHASTLSTWLRTASALAIVPLPYTLTILMPVNNTLMSMAKSAGQLSTQDAAQAAQLLQQWTSLHAVRIGLFALSTLAGIIPLLSL